MIIIKVSFKLDISVILTADKILIDLKLPGKQLIFPPHKALCKQGKK